MKMEKESDEELAEKSADSINMNRSDLSARHKQILTNMDIGVEYSTEQIAEKIGLKGPRTRQLLNELVNKYANEANQKYLGQVVKVLVEGPSKKNPDVLSGYTEHNKLINFKGDASMVGQIVDVRVTEAKTWALTGEQLESNN